MTCVLTLMVRRFRPQHINVRPPSNARSYRQRQGALLLRVLDPLPGSLHGIHSLLYVKPSLSSAGCFCPKNTGVKWLWVGSGSSIAANNDKKNDTAVWSACLLLLLSVRHHRPLRLLSSGRCHLLKPPYPKGSRSEAFQLPLPPPFHLPSPITTKTATLP